MFRQIKGLEIEAVAAQRSFVFLWCGSSDGLDHGRLCLKKWGFRRCEDICWIKTNMKQKTKALIDDSLFVRTKVCFVRMRVRKLGRGEIYYLHPRSSNRPTYSTSASYCVKLTGGFELCFECIPCLLFLR